MPAIMFKLYKQIEQNKEKNKDLVFSKKWNIVGVNLESLHTRKDLKKLKKEYNLHSLISTQSRLRYLIESSNQLDITILNIKFYPELDSEDEGLVRDLLRNKKIEKLLKLIKELFEDDIDIDSIDMMLGKNYKEFTKSVISVRRDGKLEATVTRKVKIEFSELLSKEFVGILLGKWKN